MKIIKKAAAVLSAAALMFTMNNVIPQNNEFSTTAASASVPAFPGAVGGGKYATGGRGGEVVHVTNLNDSGEGSFRDAVSKPNRIVVFDVSGTIELQGNIIVADNVTIAGQTAPGGSGITLKNYKLGMGGDNIICRYISSRPGPYKSTSSGNDGWGGAKGANSIIDHCSISWATDEQWGLYSNNEYYTVQYSIIGPADSWGGHSKGIHGFGMMMGNGYLSFDHNLLIHNVSRNFRGKVPGTKTADFTNNVIYNWAYQTAYGTIGHLNYVNNTLKMGRGTTGGKNYVNVDSTTYPENFKIYLSGNRMLNQNDTTYDAITWDNWNGITVKDGIGITKDNLKSNSSFQTIVNGENVSTASTRESAADSYNNVLTYAGNGISSDKRTAIDQQCAYETRTGTGTLSGTADYNSGDSTDKANLDKYKIQCGVTYSYPAPVLTKTIKDTDNDGMPDEWESIRGLDPNDPTDTSGDYCGQGYTNIEYYIIDLTVDSFPKGVVTLSPEVKMTKISAFDYIEAEDFSAQSGVQTEDKSDGGQNVGYIENGDYTVYRNIDFGDGAYSFTANLAGNAADIELYLDKLDGSPAAVCSFKGTGDWQDWQEYTFGTDEIKGLHTLYIKFTSPNDSYLLNIDKFKFGKTAIPNDGRLIKDLKILDSEHKRSWRIEDNVQKGDIIFGDRDFTYTELPESLTGTERLVTACDAKNLSNGKTAEFTAGGNIRVYVGLDTRVEKTPSWMTDWEKVNMSAISSNDVTFDFYSKAYSSGDKIELGANEQSYMCINFVVFVKESDTYSPPTETNEPETEPATETPTQPLPMNFTGDINEDGVLDINDISLLTDYLLKKIEFNNNQWFMADADKNEKVNVIDLVILKNRLYTDTLK